MPTLSFAVEVTTAQDAAQLAKQIAVSFFGGTNGIEISVDRSLITPATFDVNGLPATWKVQVQAVK
jgi:hypothetical protein